MRALQLPNGNLLIPVKLTDAEGDFGLQEIGEDYPEYGTWLAVSVPGEDPRKRRREADRG
jgi:hypothetical protein